MGRYARIRAAEQMDRDGIRTLSPGERGPKSHCGFLSEGYGGFRTGCKNNPRYHVKDVGVRCFTHAAPFIGRNEDRDARLPELCDRLVAGGFGREA